MMGLGEAGCVYFALRSCWDLYKHARWDGLPASLPVASAFFRQTRRSMQHQAAAPNSAPSIVAGCLPSDGASFQAIFGPDGGHRRFWVRYTISRTLVIRRRTEEPGQPPSDLFRFENRFGIGAPAVGDWYLVPTGEANETDYYTLMWYVGALDLFEGTHVFSRVEDVRPVVRDGTWRLFHNHYRVARLEQCRRAACVRPEYSNNPWSGELVMARPPSAEAEPSSSGCFFFRTSRRVLDSGHVSAECLRRRLSEQQSASLETMRQVHAYDEELHAEVARLRETNRQLEAELAAARGEIRSLEREDQRLREDTERLRRFVAGTEVSGALEFMDSIAQVRDAVQGLKQVLYTVYEGALVCPITMAQFVDPVVGVYLEHVDPDNVLHVYERDWLDRYRRAGGRSCPTTRAPISMVSGLRTVLPLKWLSQQWPGVDSAVAALESILSRMARSVPPDSVFKRKAAREEPPSPVLRSNSWRG